MIKYNASVVIKLEEEKYTIYIFKSGYKDLFVYYYEGDLDNKQHPNLDEFQKSMYHLYSKKTILTAHPELEETLDLL